MTDYHEADALAEQAAELVDRLGALEDRPQPPPLPETVQELRKRRRDVP